jgi:glycosyltransferase involved in cell wall biosynthesis
MRILHVTPLLWSGAGQVITSLCESQVDEGHRLWITTSAPVANQKDWPTYRARLTKAGVSRVRIDTFSRSPETYWDSVSRLAALIDEIRPDIVHTHAGVPAATVADARHRCTHRFGFVSHVYSWGENRPHWMNAMDATGHARADVVICSATAYVQILTRAGVAASRIINLPWGLAPSTVGRRSPNRPSPEPGAPQFGFVGRIEPRKGQLALVRGFAVARRRLRHARLDLIGPVADEVYAERIRTEIQRRGLEQAVRLRGRVPDVWSAFDAWDGFVSVSSDEGQGLAILEAMAAGVPVAARVVAGVEDYFRDGRNGIAIASARPGDVAVALEALTDVKQTRRLTRQAHTLIARRYAWPRTMSEISRIYAKVLRRR